MDDHAIDSERLRRAVADVDEQHQEAMRSLRADLDEVTDLRKSDDPAAGASRRQFLRRMGVGGAVAAVGATGISLAALLPASAQSTATSEVITDGDQPIIAFAQTAELALVALYQKAIDTKKFDSILNETARTFSLHHNDHASTLGTLLDTAAPNRGNQAIIDQFGPQITNAADQNALAQVLFQLEQAAAATYESALGKLERTFSAGPVSTILPIEGQQAVVWGQVLNLPMDQWLPAFQNDADALDLSKYPS
jgi:hypothetical protein